jgi:transcriptional antiterminator NusG
MVERDRLPVFAMSDATTEEVTSGSQAQASEDAPMSWYIVNTFSGYENSVKRSLEDRIKSASLEACFEDILVPSEQVSERKGKRVVKLTKKFFPGYIFVRMALTKGAWHLVKNTPKVSGFLGGNTPRPVPQSEMDKMLGKAQPAPVVEPEEQVVTYRAGEQVRVKSGAFANFTGEVEEVNTDKRKIKLSVSIFGRPTRVEVDFSEVEPAAP